MTGRRRRGKGLLHLYPDKSTPHGAVHGVSGDLKSRVHQHREKLLPGFTNRYNVCKLVYHEAGYNASGAIAREKQIKAGSRQKKLELINRLNPEWRDLYEQL
jgi:putative endonuclease